MIAIQSYTRFFISNEEGSSTIEMVCIIACAVGLIAALYNLAGRLDENAANAKKDAIVAGSRKGYGNVKIR